MSMPSKIDRDTEAASPRYRRRAIILLTGILALVVVALGIRLVQVHDETRDWRLTPAAAPTLLNFSGHDFLRGGMLDQHEFDALGSFTADGLTAGGAQIFIPAVAATRPSSTPTLVVLSGGSRFVYTMNGGM